MLNPNMAKKNLNFQIFWNTLKTLDLSCEVDTWGWECFLVIFLHLRELSCLEHERVLKMDRIRLAFEFGIVCSSWNSQLYVSGSTFNHSVCWLWLSLYHLGIGKKMHGKNIYTIKRDPITVEWTSEMDAPMYAAILNISSTHGTVHWTVFNRAIIWL